MKRMLKFCLSTCVTLSSVSASASEEKISVFVEYKHGPIHVHYTIPCEYKMPCTLSSSEGEPVSWHLEVTPEYTQNGIVSVKTKIVENDKEISHSTVLNKLGEMSKIVSNGPDGEALELSVRPFGS